MCKPFKKLFPLVLLYVHKTGNRVSKHNHKNIKSVDSSYRIGFPCYLQIFHQQTLVECLRVLKPVFTTVKGKNNGRNIFIALASLTSPPWNIDFFVHDCCWDEHLTSVYKSVLRFSFLYKSTSLSVSSSVKLLRLLILILISLSKLLSFRFFWKGDTSKFLRKKPRSTPEVGGRISNAYLNNFMVSRNLIKSTHKHIPPKK